MSEEFNRIFGPPILKKYEFGDGRKAEIIVHEYGADLEFTDLFNRVLLKESEIEMSEERIKELESEVEGKEVAPVTFAAPALTSPAGDAALKFLDAEFGKINEYLTLKLKDGFAKTFALAQLQGLYFLVRGFVSTQLS